MEAAVPPYRSDAAASAAAVGELYLYVRQLTSRIAELADKANSLDDERIALEQRNGELEGQLASVHAHNDTLQDRVSTLEEKLNAALDHEAGCRHCCP